MTIKTLTTVFALLLTLTFASAQTFDWGQSYGLGSGNTSYDDRVTSVEYSEVLDKIILSGYYYESTDIAIGSSDIILLQETELGEQGFFVVYEPNGDVSFSLNIGSSISQIEFLNDSTFLISGRFRGSYDFDKREDSELIFTSEAPNGDGFFGCYRTDGTPLWFKHFVPGFVGGPSSFAIQDDQVIVVSNAQQGLTFDPEGVDINYSTSPTSGSILMGLNLADGFLEWDKVINTSDHQNTSDLINFAGNERFILGMRCDATSNLDIGITETQEIDVNEVAALIFPVYSTTNQELENYLKIETEYGQIRVKSLVTNSSGELFLSFTNTTNNLYVKDFNGSEYEIDVSEDIPSKSFVLKFNRNLDLVWIYSNEHSDAFNVYELDVLNNNNIYLYGSFSGDITTSATIYETTTNNNIYLQEIKANGTGGWLSYIANESGSISGSGFLINEVGETFLGGSYSSNPNFSFTSEDGLHNLGSNAAQEGYFCKYQIEGFVNQEAQVYLQTPYFDSIPESETLNSHLFISKLPTESVEVTLTPDDQLDLGNGQGEPVVLTFDNSEPLSDQMFDVSITAFDDEAVEDEFHSGIIQIEVSSADAEFEAIESFSEELILIDDDVDSVDERNKDSQISVYPNPATDEIKIDYPENLSGKTIDLIRILDGNGRAVLEIKDHPKDQPVSVKDLSKGSYILKVNSGGIEFSSKLLIK